MTQFITLAGKKQVGKDTSAKMIKELINPLWTHEQVRADPDGYLALKDNIHIVHFADALKKACHIIFGIPLEDMETEEGKQKLTRVRWPRDHSFEPTWEGMDGRDAYKVSSYRPGNKHSDFMTIREVLQFVGTELFRNQLDPDVWLNSIFLKPWAEDDIVIIADARFPNEAALSREHGLLISVERDTGLVSDGHRSENALGEYADYHYTVDNNSSFNELRTELNTILVAHSLLV